MADKNDSDGTDRTDKNAPQLRLGLKPNINQFLLLILVNAFVGAMIGLEQTSMVYDGKYENRFSRKREKRPGFGAK